MDTETFFTILVLGSSMAVIVLFGVEVLMRNAHDRLNQSFFALSFASAVWILTNLIFAISEQSTTQYISASLSYGAAGLLALFFLYYCLALARITLKRELSITLLIFGVVLSFVSGLPNIVVNGVVENKVVTNELPFVLFGLYLLASIASGLIVLVQAYAKLKRAERNRIAIVLGGLVLAASMWLFFNIILPVIGNPSFVRVGSASALVLVATGTYAIVKHGLFDIHLVAVRALGYGGVLLTLSVIYYLLAYVFSVVVLRSQVSDISVSPANVLIALVLAFLFQPIKRFFDRVTNSVFYRNSYKTDEFFADLSELLASTTDLRGLLERTSSKFSHTFKSSQTFFFIHFTNEKDHHMSAGTPGHDKLTPDDARVLSDYVASTDTGIFLTQMLDEDANILHVLRRHKIELVMPLRHGDHVTGYVMLGEHLSGSYTKRDLSVLSAVRNELVIAIQNALSLQELKELNATLQHRIDTATKELRVSNAQLKRIDEVKDEFMSIASHQLRTPLTSIKGYLSMVLEGDVGNLTLRQRRLLQEAYNSSERMVRLIADFLNVSRLQTGKFTIEKTSFDLHDAIKEEIGSLKMIAESHHMKLRLEVPGSDSWPVVADEQKIRQVIMNFVDNAIYYSRQNSTIVVNLQRIKNEVMFTVVDTGIGIPEEDQPKLFTKFFRAKNARKQRPDGTGVGLYLARRVVTAHGGSIVFKSEEGKGSTFGFRLPLDMAKKTVESQERELTAVR